MSDNDEDFDAWAAEVSNTLVPKIEASTVVASLVPKGETDIKFAVELGVAIMLDKPIIALVVPGVKVPAKLVKVVDRVVEFDLDNDSEGTTNRLLAAMEELRTNT